MWHEGNKEVAIFVTLYNVVFFAIFFNSYFIIIFWFVCCLSSFFRGGGGGGGVCYIVHENTGKPPMRKTSCL